jgi:hypothetical protein
MLRIRWVKPVDGGNSQNWLEQRGVAKRNPPVPRMLPERIGSVKDY